MITTNKVKIAIAGCGLITRASHLPAALRSPKVEVFALIDSRVANAEALAKDFALKCHIAKDVSEVIDKVEGVLIATPNHTHYPIAEVALKLGIPVLIEKPITTTYEDAIRLCELAQETKAFISVGYRTRYFPSVNMMKKLLDQSFFGKINHFYYEFGTKGGWAPVSGYNIDRKKSGGGVLVVSGTHFLDRMLYWFDEPKKFIYKDDSYGGVEANCKAELFFENDTGNFTGTFFMSKTTGLKNKFILDTEKYVCELNEKDSEKITLFPKNDSSLKMELSPNATQNQIKMSSIQKQLEEFADNIRRPGKITVDGWFAARSIKLIEEMYKNRSLLEEPWVTYKGRMEKEEYAQA